MDNWLAQRIPNPNHEFFLRNLSLGLILCQTSSEARLCNHACSFIIIFRADLFLIDWALPCSVTQDSQLGSPPKTRLAQRCLCPPLLTGGYWPELKLPLFCHSRLFFLGLGWLSKSYWMLCRVGSPSCTVYIGNGALCSGVAEGVGRVTHKSTLSAS